MNAPPCHQPKISADPSEFSNLCPAMSDKAVMEKLKAVVDDAAARNLAQADLLDKIKGLGSVAFGIVKTAFPSLL